MWSSGKEQRWKNGHQGRRRKKLHFRRPTLCRMASWLRQCTRVDKRPGLLHERLVSSFFFWLRGAGVCRWTWQLHNTGARVGVVMLMLPMNNDIYTFIRKYARTGSCKLGLRYSSFVDVQMHPSSKIAICTDPSRLGGGEVRLCYFCTRNDNCQSFALASQEVATPPMLLLPLLPENCVRMRASPYWRSGHKRMPRTQAK